MNYNGPGNTNDLNAALIAKWHETLNLYFNEGKRVAQEEAVPPYNRSWLFNPLADGTANTGIADITWNAFPKRLLTQEPSKISAWRKADSARNYQEEYCEWETIRNESNQLTQAIFTTETPDYYRFLYHNDKDLLLQLYKDHVSPQVTIADLESNGRYDTKNKWNFAATTQNNGAIMHMGHDPNTLWAAIALSAEATWPSVDQNGNPITDEQGLINCRRFGSAARHSDPHIGAQINELVRLGNEVSFAGPVGLYIDSIDFARYEFPEGTSKDDFFHLVRGDAEHMMRIEFKAPEGSELTLSDVSIDGEPILFGGQIAETLDIRIRGLARNIGEVPPSIDCQGAIQPSTVFAEAVAFASESSRKEKA